MLQDIFQAFTPVASGVHYGREGGRRAASEKRAGQPLGDGQVSGFFTDSNGEERRTDEWYEYPFLSKKHSFHGCPMAWLPIEIERSSRLRRLLADGTVDCWPCFQYPHAEPVAWMVVGEGQYEI